MPLTQEQIDSFLDWREAGGTARPEGGKDEYYNGLTKPYNTREGRILTVSELLQIKGWTPDVLYNVQSNTVTVGKTNNNTPVSPISELVSLNCYSGLYDPQGNGKRNINAATLTAQQLQQSAQIPAQVATAIINARNLQPNRQFARLSQVLNVQGIVGNQQNIRNVLDRMSISTTTNIEGKVNINTATAEVLADLPGVTEDIANQIVDSRPTDGYKQLSDVLSVSQDRTFLATVADILNVNSQSFRVRVIGKAGTSTVGLEAIVTIVQTIPTVVMIEESSLGNLPDRWGWTSDGNTTTLLENK